MNGAVAMGVVIEMHTVTPQSPRQVRVNPDQHRFSCTVWGLIWGPQRIDYENSKILHRLARM
jgi:hypothetical protein